MASAQPVVRVGVGVFILYSRHEPASNPRVLVGKRKNAHGAGTYALPGGHLEFGETPDECAVREVDEETGLRVGKVRFLTATNDYWPTERHHYVTMFMVCEREVDTDEPRLMEPHKCEGWEWVNWQDLTLWGKLQIEAVEGDKLEKQLFLPLLDLFQQRQGMLPTSH